MTALTTGQTAPDFELPRGGGGSLRLSDLAGKSVVLYFYPKDDTTGCTAESIDFSQLKAQFEAVGAVVIGMSPDSVKATTNSRRSIHSTSISSPMKAGRRSRPTAYGPRRACMAANIWVSNARPS